MQPRPETARHIDEIGTKLFAGLGSNAISVEVYGSAASDDFAPRHSDVNLFVALHNVSFADLRLIGTVLQRESDRLGLRFATPLVVRPDFLDTAGDSFPIELTDMRLRHRLRLPDAIQVAVAIQAGCHALVTHDRDFAGVTDLLVLGLPGA